jgi:signal peptidase II
MASESSQREAGQRLPGSPQEPAAPERQVVTESDAAGPADLATQPPVDRRRQALMLLGGVALGVLALDQITKELATGLDPAEPVRVLGGFIYLSLTRNPGAAFSLLREHTYIFPVIAVGVLAWIGFMARRLRSLPWAVSLGLVFGGAAGNLADRIFRAPAALHGHVVDFLSLLAPYGDRWPIFNVADISLVTGVGLAVLLELKGLGRDGSRIPARPARDGAQGHLSADRGSQAWPS